MYNTLSLFSNENRKRESSHQKRGCSVKQHGKLDILSSFLAVSLNFIVDSLSRFQMDCFCRVAPNTDLGPMPCAPRTLGDLNADIQNYLSLSVAASTKHTYHSDERFVEFCASHSPHKSTHLLTNEETLIQYAAYLAKTIKHSSIKGHLAAVRHLHIRSGYQLDLACDLPWY